jgi:hypothetical protein
VLNYALRHEGVWGSGCIDPHFLDLGTSWRGVVSFSPRSLNPRYPLDSRLGGPQNRSGRREEGKILDHTGTRTPTPRSSNFLFSTLSRPALGPTYPPVQWEPGALSPGVKRQGGEADHSPPASAEVKKMCVYTSSPPYAFMA